jgi:hypothetical protein
MTASPSRSGRAAYRSPEREDGSFAEASPVEAWTDVDEVRVALHQALRRCRGSRRALESTPVPA